MEQNKSSSNNVNLEDVEELTKIALSDDSSPALHTTHDILGFLIYFNIKPGKFLFSADNLYKVYQAWSKEPKDKLEFIKFVKKIILDKVQHHKRYFRVSLEPLRITEALYRFLESKKVNPTKVPNYKKHVDHFFNYYGIEAGNDFIPARSLYYYYDLWTYKNKSRKPLAYNILMKFCGQYFKTKIVAKDKETKTYIGINKSKLKLTQEQLDFATQWSDIRNEKQFEKRFERKEVRIKRFIQRTKRKHKRKNKEK